MSNRKKLKGFMKPSKIRTTPQMRELFALDSEIDKTFDEQQKDKKP